MRESLLGGLKRKEIPKAMLRHPARDPAELDALVLAQIKEDERSLFFRRQLWHQSQDLLLWRNPPRSATLHNASQMLSSS